MNIFDVLARSARRFGERGALWLGNDCLLDFAGLHDRALRLGAALRAQHPTGARIAVVSQNRPEYLELMFGTWAAGLVLVPINAKLHPNEVLPVLADCGAVACFASPDLADALQPALDAVSARPRCTVIGSAEYHALFSPMPAPSGSAAASGSPAPASDAPDAPAPAADCAPDAVAWLFYTSGTTGRSKGAMLTHRNLWAMTIAHLADIETIDEQRSQIHAAPMSHGSGLYIPAYVLRGARQVLPVSAGFDPAEFLALADHHPGCGAFLAPTMVQRLRLEAERSGRRPSRLTSLIYGGGPMYVEELRKALKVFGPVFVQIYGQGESPMTITALRRADHDLDDDAILGSVGEARSGMEVAVHDAAGLPVATGQIGEIVCRGDVVMAGYWNNPAATEQTLNGGWLHTGDMGSLDARGYLTLRDRSKDVIISGGSNIYPREVEEVLLTCPGVAEACVVGERDAEWGENVVAFIVAEPGMLLAPAALDAHCLRHIARFKRPKRYLMVDSLPKNSYGKVLKRALRERLEG